MTAPGFAFGVEPVAVGPKIKLLAIFENKVIIKIDGQRIVLTKDRPGPQGIILRFSDTRNESADIEINGKLETMPLGYVMSASSGAGAGASSNQSITLHTSANGSFFADGYINNIPVKFLVDTGADTVAFSSEMANRLGVDYRRGEKAIAVTAAGYAETYLFDLEQVDVGGLTLRFVKASVIEGRHPEIPLLGMSFLGSFDMKREGDRMEIFQRK